MQTGKMGPRTEVEEEPTIVTAAHATSHQPGGADALAVDAAAATGMTVPRTSVLLPVFQFGV